MLLYHPNGYREIDDDLVATMQAIRSLQRDQQRLLLNGGEAKNRTELHRIRSKLTELEPLRLQYIRQRFF